jgi:hypothetical protein
VEGQCSKQLLVEGHNVLQQLPRQQGACRTTLGLCCCSCAAAAAIHLHIITRTCICCWWGLVGVHVVTGFLTRQVSKGGKVVREGGLVGRLLLLLHQQQQNNKT